MALNRFSVRAYPLNAWLPSNLPTGWVIVFIHPDVYDDDVTEHWDMVGVYHLIRYLPKDTI